MRRAFTLIELLVVIVIILIVSVLTLPTVINALSHRQVSEGARIVQAELAGARDAAARDNAPHGVRFIPDQTAPIDLTKPLTYSRMIPISVPPRYTEGGLAIYDPASYADAIRTVNGYPGVPCLVVEEAVLSPQGTPNAPTSWYWNIRIGDKIQIANSGPWYTICGPMFTPNVEQFVNVGPPGTRSPLQRGTMFPEFLLLMNGRDDNGDGWVDSGFDGVDNDLKYEKDNNLPKLTDDPREWEVEKWL